MDSKYENYSCYIMVSLLCLVKVYGVIVGESSIEITRRVWALPLN